MGLAALGAKAAAQPAAPHPDDGHLGEASGYSGVKP
jgi:hypothetical protein